MSIPFRYFGPVPDPFGSIRLCILTDPIPISRSAYGMLWDHKMPDDSPQLAGVVTVRLSAEATKDK